MPIPDLNGSSFTPPDLIVSPTAGTPKPVSGLAGEPSEPMGYITYRDRSQRWTRFEG